MLLYAFLTYRGDPVRISPNTRVIIYATGRYKIEMPNPLSAGPRWIECELVSLLPQPFGRKRPKKSSAATAMAFLEGLAVGGDFEITLESSKDPREMIYVIRQRKWTAGDRKRALLARDRPRPEPPPRTTNPVEILQHDLIWVEMSTWLANRLMKGTAKRPGAGFTYLWQAFRLSKAELRKLLGRGVYYREFEELAEKLGFPIGTPLPSGDYPWNQET